jgi:hypothetical protein
MVDGRAHRVDASELKLRRACLAEHLDNEPRIAGVVLDEKGMDQGV